MGTISLERVGLKRHGLVSRSCPVFSTRVANGESSGLEGLDLATDGESSEESPGHILVLTPTSVISQRPMWDTNWELLSEEDADSYLGIQVSPNFGNFERRVFRREPLGTVFESWKGFLESDLSQDMESVSKKRFAQTTRGRKELSLHILFQKSTDESSKSE